MYRVAWFWVELVICFSWPAVFAFFACFSLTHIVVTTVFFGSWPDLEAGSYRGMFYGIATALGIASTVTLLVTGFGKSAPRGWLVASKAGLVLGLIAAIYAPEGSMLAERRFETLQLRRELFACVLPAFCYLHFGFLSRRYLFAAAEHR